MPTFRKKNTVSIFRAEVAMLGSGGIYTELEEGRVEEPIRDEE
jgi:hypothetical protein